MTGIELASLIVGVSFLSILLTVALFVWFILSQPQLSSVNVEEMRRALEGEQTASRWLARRCIYHIRAKKCVIREARRWKALYLAEVQANNRAFDAGVRAHATGVVNYTGDEPEGVRL